MPRDSLSARVEGDQESFSGRRLHAYALNMCSRMGERLNCQGERVWKGGGERARLSRPLGSLQSDPGARRGGMARL